MKKVFKRASLVALSALMLGTSVASLASCGGKNNDDGVIDVFVFAGVDDQDTNRTLVENWAEKYAAKLRAADPATYGADFKIATNCKFQSDTTKYFSTLANELAAGEAPDVFYVSPKYVKAYSKVGYVLNLADYIDFSDTSAYDITKVFGDAIGLYAYDGAHSGATVNYDAATKTFKTESYGTEAGIYGLPKDYSSFGLGYNKLFFTDALKNAYKTTSVIAADAASSSVGGSIIRNAVTGAASKGIINVGEATTYYPYNFYLFDSYDDALKAGDPVAEASKSVGGYTVTLPGLPGESFEKTPDPTQPYDDTKAYTTFTYAEYGAITWAVTYYYAKYVKGTAESWLGDATVYGNDQYEGTLYLLPWLAGNNADYINAREGTGADGKTYAPYTSVKSGTYLNDDGVTINYGVDNEKFIEAEAAFAAYGMDWNGNCYYAGDGLGKDGGWQLFLAGRCVFYGVGTWNMADFNQVDPAIMQYAMMPEPVSENYALYSSIKNAKDEAQAYGEKKASFTEAEIQANQLIRQDKWAGRMDSVGYGVNGKLAYNESANKDWFAAACADLVANMTIDYDAQVKLTLAGSQLPNYEFMYKEMLDGTGFFEGLVTPDDMDKYSKYYAIAQEMVNSQDKNTTAEAFLKEKGVAYNKSSDLLSKKLNKISTYVKAFELLNMIQGDYDTRNLFYRMAAGTNGVKDSCMYTFSSAWIDVLGNNKAVLFAWNQKNDLNGKFAGISKTWVNNSTFCTVNAFCNGVVDDMQLILDGAVAEEAAIIG